MANLSLTNNFGLYYTANQTEALDIIARGNTGTYKYRYYASNDGQIIRINDSIFSITSEGYTYDVGTELATLTATNFVGWKLANTKGSLDGNGSSGYTIIHTSIGTNEQVFINSVSATFLPNDTIVDNPTDNNTKKYNDLTIPWILYPVYGTGGGGGVICFLEGTKILSKINDEELYVPIEKLELGTLVKTRLNGFKPINGIGHRVITNTPSLGRTHNNLYVCRKEVYPDLSEDLYITGGHSILVPELTDLQRSKISEIYVTEGMYRLSAYNDEKTEVCSKEGDHNIWHISLEAPPSTNYGIYANGLLVESCFKYYMNKDRFTTIMISD